MPLYTRARRMPIKGSSYSRNRVAAARRSNEARRAATLSARRGVPLAAGYTRTAGFYGRYQGPNAEKKFFDTAINFLVDATGEVPATGQLNLIPQGVTESTRVGRKCTIKNINMRGNWLYAPGAAAQGATNVCVMLVLDKQANGAAAAATDVMTNANFFSALRNLSNVDRFVVLKKWEKSVNTGAGVTTAYTNVCGTWKFNKSCNIPIEFSSTTGAITEIKSNNLFLIASTDGTSDDLVTWAGICRVRFSDQ